MYDGDHVHLYAPNPNHMDIVPLEQLATYQNMHITSIIIYFAFHLNRRLLAAVYIFPDIEYRNRKFYKFLDRMCYS